MQSQQEQIETKKKTIYRMWRINQDYQKDLRKAQVRKKKWDLNSNLENLEKKEKI